MDRKNPGVPVAELLAICGPDRVVTEHHALRTYESDGLLQYAVVPAAAVLPDTTEEVAAVVAACHRAKVPWVARGSGTGLSGGAVPVEDGVLISLARMRRILNVDLDNQRVVVQPGVTNAEVTAAVAPTHFYPPDPSSQIICSIGGNVAENSGGVHCFKYGFTTNYVTGAEVVLPDGEVVRLGGAELDRSTSFCPAGARPSAARAGWRTCRRRPAGIWIASRSWWGSRSAPSRWGPSGTRSSRVECANNESAGRPGPSAAPAARGRRRPRRA